MTRTWADFRVVATRPDATTHWQLPDNGWHAFIAWAAGPAWVVATTDRATRSPVRVEREHSDGTVERWTETFTDADQGLIDESIDEDLTHVGLPTRPRGVDWYLRVRADDRERALSTIDAAVGRAIPADIDGAEYLPAARSAMDEVVPRVLTSFEPA